MADITVTIRAELPGTFDEEYQEVIHISPAHGPLERRMLFAVSVENIGWHALQQAELPTPIHDALLGHDAKLLHLEEMVVELVRDWSETLPPALLARLREIILVDGYEAHERWGQHHIEPIEEEDPSTDEDPPTDHAHEPPVNDS